MGHGGRQFDMPHALAPDAGTRHLDTASVADDIPELVALVFAAVALPILDRAEYLFAKETIFFRPE